MTQFALRLAPVTLTEARCMIDEVRGFALIRLTNEDKP